MRLGWKWWSRILAGVLGAMLLVAVVSLPQTHPIDKATVDTIRPGMSRAEVEARLGGRGFADTRTSVPGQTKAAWMGSGGGCVVVFDAENRVVSASHGPMKWSAVERAGIRVLYRAREWAPDWD